VHRFYAVIDLVIVVLFVGIGRSVHDHGVSVGGLTSTTWPFAAGLVIGWLVLFATRRTGATLRDGVAVCLATVSVGMVLRVLAGQGTAVAFVAVALAFLGAAMLGWRFGLRAITRHRGPRSSSA
jgi:hypothetical protein